MPNDRWSWDATTTLEALGAADVVLWLWEPEKDRLRLTGASRALGLGPLAPECSSAAIRALALPPDRALAEDMLRVQEPGSEIAVRLRMRGGGVCIWRGVWLEDGGLRAAGVIAPEVKFAASDLDSLTGLLDRKSFVTRARERLQSPGQHELVVADLDRLRRLNEALGHERADLVLAALGSRLAAAFPPNALLARVGEDEFAVLAPTSRPSAAETLRQALEQPLRVAGFDIHPTLSIGAVEAVGGEDAPEAAELLRRAELAVESAKSNGRGGAAAYGRSLESDGLSRLALESDLRGAMGRNEIVPFYQPIVRLSTGALSGFEALVRWRHPRRGLLTPDQFLPLCEEMGLMSELGAMMMRQAGHQLATWRRDHRAAGELTVAVNLSTGEIDRPDLISDVIAIRRETGLPPGALKLEVTEGDVMRDPDRAAVVLRNLREAGAALALDDFGTGFSSLSYLTRLPFDTLKIDRYFVRTMATNEGSVKIVSSVVKLGEDLDLEVVAEGVENAQMARHLLSLGCDYGQGFGYAPALSPQEAEVYLNESYVDGAAPVKARG
ncbi:MAG: bifunctional diguanylate cyclase/phosphodiesterase [Pseudomonadota bacterium]|uniref:putative bifunctional diguanylate cyclase/phosphodiesterase n=1 Tax=Phenylobacterium sp. TaxID=1871053 RepID=UPI0025D84D6E|nr:bifunctional diguanylate cyclase/phosphodiesterase [Phenylobacterium sp.]MBT9471186.1 bifunctional diguanylate cyclase/phosphodiesterase [Phenylobacterium sp.]